MPWRQQGGSGGPGGQGPWGRGSGGPVPPDLEDLLRRGQDRFKRFVPGGFGSSRGILVLVLIALAIWLASGFYRVQPEEQGVVLQFGRFDRTTGPGLHYHLPSPIESKLTPAVERVHQMEVGLRTADPGSNLPPQDIIEESLMLTGDENIVDIDFTVFWKISNSKNYLFNILGPEQTVKLASESAMREVVGQTPIQAALTEGRQQIEGQTRQRLQFLLDEYGAGIEITRVQLLKIDPPQPVIDAFIEVQRAQADLERLRNEAEAYRNDILPRARGEAEQRIQGARAYREEVINRAQGEAQRFLEVYKAYVQSKDVTKQRMYLETLETVFQGMTKIIIDSRGGSGVVPYLPLPELRKRAVESGSAGESQ